ncbi:MAG: hypothetical protein ACC700_15670 [Anaerolineales bacterium]
MSLHPDDGKRFYVVWSTSERLRFFQLIAMVAIFTAGAALFLPRLRIHYYGKFGSESPYICIDSAGKTHIQYDTVEGYVVENTGRVGITLLTFFSNDLWGADTGRQGIRVFSKHEGIRGRDDYISWCQRENTTCNPWLDERIFLFSQEDIEIPSGETAYLAIQRFIGFELEESVGLRDAAEFIDAQEFTDLVKFRFSRNIDRDFPVDLYDLSFDKDAVLERSDNEIEACSF